MKAFVTLSGTALIKDEAQQIYEQVKKAVPAGYIADFALDVSEDGREMCVLKIYLNRETPHKEGTNRPPKCGKRELSFYR